MKRCFFPIRDPEFFLTEGREGSEGSKGELNHGSHGVRGTEDAAAAEDGRIDDG